MSYNEDAEPFQVRYYQTAAGKRPFQDWLDSQDCLTQQRVLHREGEAVKRSAKASVSYRDDLLRRLKDPEFAAGYLTRCLEDSEGTFLVGLRDVAEVHGGIRQVAKRADLNREHLFRMLSKGGNPRLHNLRQLVDAVGLRLSVRPA